MNTYTITDILLKQNVLMLSKFNNNINKERVVKWFLKNVWKSTIKTEYELELEVIINDPMLWHDLRHTVDRDYLAPISLTLIKQGSGAVREQIQVLIDDYIISEACYPHQC